ncbi:hypothetical protein [Agromyces humatus]|uniref:Uncharacterized protein n=1 Tax=Agromyces humatus TaxID=279573 RepID=A0ABN2L015_9MICO|nr:hypothetical protein [Agromyces humatus]
MNELASLLDHMERGRWPVQSDEEAWRLLATWAFQTECLQTDEAENVAWETEMRELLRRDLPYAEFVEQRMAALSRRLQARKLAQTNLRYKYGFKPRSGSLVRRDVRRFYRSWSED